MSEIWRKCLERLIAEKTANQGHLRDSCSQQNLQAAEKNYYSFCLFESDENRQDNLLEKIVYSFFLYKLFQI